MAKIQNNIAKIATTVKGIVYQICGPKLFLENKIATGKNTNKNIKSEVIGQVIKDKVVVDQHLDFKVDEVIKAYNRGWRKNFETLA